MRDKTAGDVKDTIGTSYASLTRLVNDFGLGRDKAHGIYLYDLSEVTAAIKKRDTDAQARAAARRGKPRNYKKRPVRTRDFSAGNSAEPVNVVVSDGDKRQSSGDRYYPAVGGSAIRIFADMSGSNGVAI